MARVQTVGAQHAGPVFQSHCILRASIKAQLKTEQPIIMSMITYASHQETCITIVRSDPTSWSRFDRLWGSLGQLGRAGMEEAPIKCSWGGAPALSLAVTVFYDLDLVRLRRAPRGPLPRAAACGLRSPAGRAEQRAGAD